MKCKFCDGSGKDNWCLNGEPYPCPVCEGTGETEQTNDEWRKTCSTEEMAEMLANESKNVINDFENFDFKREHKEFWEMWLKQPHHESVSKCNE